MDPSQAIADFCGVTGASDAKAREFLEASNFDVQQAAANYFAATEQDDDDDDVDTDVDEPNDGPGPASAAPIGSSGQSSSNAQASSSHKKPPKPKSKFSSLGDLKRSEEANEADDDSDKDQEYFAGGDKSALAVQDPSNSNRKQSANDHIQRLLQTARENHERPGSPPRDGPSSRPNAFSGSGQTLGGDDAPSRPIPATHPTASARTRPTPSNMVERTLHLWADGFSVDDGPLYRYDDPANSRYLEMINRGSAPLDIMNISQGQAVDVKLETHRGEPYVRPKKKYRPFQDGGQRLGSPTPGDPASSASSASQQNPGESPQHSATTTSAAANSSTSTTAAAPTNPQLNPAEPTVSLQIRLADGTRLPARFNTSATVQEVYEFVDRSSAGQSDRAYMLATTFPTKELADRGVTLQDLAELRRGGVVVQKWA